MTSKKVQKTDEQLKVLEKYYAEGMISYGKDNILGRELMGKAVSETGLSENQVKNWIEAKRKKKNPIMKLPSRQCRGYDLFRKEYVANIKGASLSSKDILLQANNAWMGKSEEEKREFKERAKQIVAPTFDDLSIDDQKRKISSVRKRIDQLCQELTSYGVITTVLDIDPSRTGSLVNVYGAEKGINFVNENSDIVHQYSAYHTPGCLPSSQLEKEVDRRVIAEHINKKIYESSNGKWKRFPYSKYSEDPTIIDVIGLPEFMIFKNPSNYSKVELRLLSEHLDGLAFKVNSYTVESTNQVNEAVSTSQEIDNMEPRGNTEPEPQNSIPITKVDFGTSDTNEFQDIPTKRRHVEVEAELDDVCKTLNLTDFVPSQVGLSFTLAEVFEKASEGEGYIDYIKGHKKKGKETLFYVKWIGYKNPTWELSCNIPGNFIADYLSKES